MSWSSKIIRLGRCASTRATPPRPLTKPWINCRSCLKRTWRCSVSPAGICTSTSVHGTGDHTSRYMAMTSAKVTR
ncbi:hypothetical protein D3C77_561910 [compost metagenome]